MSPGIIGLDLRCIDSPSVRASRSAAGAGKKGIPRGTIRTFVFGRAVEHQPAMALVKRSPKRTAIL
jgi:hypothetical protein